MSKARQLADLLDSNGDVTTGALDNVPPSNDASALTTGTLDAARIADGSIAAGKLTDTYLTGIADGSITDAKLNSSLDLSGKTVTLPAGTGGKVLQVVQTFSSSAAVYGPNSGSWNTLSELTTSITPTSTSSKLLISIHMTGGPYSGIEKTPWGIFRGATQIALGDASSSRPRTTSDAGGVSDAWPSNQAFMYLDSPNTDQQVTYYIKWYGISTSSFWYFNRSGVDRNGTDSRTVSSVIIQEIAG